MCKWEKLENDEAWEINAMTIFWPQYHCAPLHRPPAELSSTPPPTSPDHVDTSPETNVDKSPLANIYSLLHWKAQMQVLFKYTLERISAGHLMQLVDRKIRSISILA